jgi:hypothetical protein
MASALLCLEFPFRCAAATSGRYLPLSSSPCFEGCAFGVLQAVPAAVLSYVGDSALLVETSCSPSAWLSCNGCSAWFCAQDPCFCVSSIHGRERRAWSGSSKGHHCCNSTHLHVVALPSALCRFTQRTIHAAAGVAVAVRAECRGFWMGAECALVAGRWRHVSTCSVAGRAAASCALFVMSRRIGFQASHSVPFRFWYHPCCSPQAAVAAMCGGCAVDPLCQWTTFKGMACPISRFFGCLSLLQDFTQWVYGTQNHQRPVGGLCLSAAAACVFCAVEDS